MNRPLKQILFKSSQEWASWLDAAADRLDQSRSDLIRAAIEEYVAKHAPEAGTPPGAIAPHGYRHDQRPEGWRSRLYRDRYQFVAIATARGFAEISHLHETARRNGKPAMQAGGDVPHKWESYIYGELPSDVLPIDIANDLALELMSEDRAYLWDRD